MTNRCRALTVLIVALLAGCGAEPDRRAPVALPGAAVDMDAAVTRATALKRPMLVLVIESGKSAADQDARALLESPAMRKKSGGVDFLVMDIRLSRNRATATRFGITDTPVLLCLSPRGLTVSRDEGPITAELVARRIDEVVKQSPTLDGALAVFEEAVAKNPDDAEAQLELAVFLLAQQSVREAIPHLAAIARSEKADTGQRVQAWVTLAMAHLSIAEPEKCRHEAADLMAVLGPRTPEARAGGELVLGHQDAKAKRVALARREFEEAIKAAPASVFAREAAEAMAKLPKGGS